MSQNSIITTIIVILAVTVGVYFYFSAAPSPKTDAIVYEDSKPVVPSEPISTNSSETINNNDTDTLASSTQPIAPSTTSTQPSEPLSNQSSSTEGSSTNPGDVKPPEPVIITYSYTVVIKGTVARLAKPFAIKAIDKEGLSEEFAQDQLVDGSYKFESLKMFSSISINVEGYAPVLKENLVLNDKKLSIEIEMEAYATFSGDVKSFQEKPITGASITIEKGSYKKTLHANTQGEFKMTELIPFGQYSFTINHPQFDSKKMVVELGKGDEKIINIKLERDALVDGIVNTSEGKPAAKLDGILKHDSDATKNKSFTTDDKGHFQLSKITEGKYSLEFNSIQGSLVESLAFAKNIEMVREFKLLPPPSVSGIIVDEAGKPVSGVKIYTFDDKAIVEDETKADGKFTLTLLKKGDYRLLTTSETFEILNASKMYAPSLEKVVVQLKKKVFLKGKILTSSGLTVKKDFTLKLLNKTKKTSIPIFASINKEGRILIPMSTFKFISADDEIQIAVESTYGKGVSLTMKVSSLSEENEFLITLGE